MGPSGGSRNVGERHRRMRGEPGPEETGPQHAHTHTDGRGRSGGSRRERAPGAARTRSRSLRADAGAVWGGRGARNPQQTARYPKCCGAPGSRCREPHGAQRHSARRPSRSGGPGDAKRKSPRTEENTARGRGRRAPCKRAAASRRGRRAVCGEPRGSSGTRRQLCTLLQGPPRRVPFAQDGPSRAAVLHKP